MHTWSDNGFYEGRDQDTASIYFEGEYVRRPVRWEIATAGDERQDKE